jgi:ABC-type transporter Mla MlaB component
MLRITQVSGNGVPTLKLEGNLAGAWVGELQQAVAVCLSRWPAVQLDLSEVRYVDANGAALLHTLTKEGVAVCNRSRFVAELLEGGNR